MAATNSSSNGGGGSAASSDDDGAGRGVGGGSERNAVLSRSAGAANRSIGSRGRRSVWPLKRQLAISIGAVRRRGQASNSLSAPVRRNHLDSDDQFCLGSLS